MHGFSFVPFASFARPIPKLEKSGHEFPKLGTTNKH